MKALVNVRECECAGRCDGGTRRRGRHKRRCTPHNAIAQTKTYLIVVSYIPSEIFSSLLQSVYQFRPTVPSQRGRAPMRRPPWRRTRGRRGVLLAQSVNCDCCLSVCRWGVGREEGRKGMGDVARRRARTINGGDVESAARTSDGGRGSWIWVGHKGGASAVLCAMSRSRLVSIISLSLVARRRSSFVTRPSSVLRMLL